MLKLRNLNWIARHTHYNEDNFHRIAISNLSDSRKKMQRWWENKYQTYSKSFEDHTEEEIYILMLEEYYDTNPSQIERFWESVGSDEWDGETDAEYEREIKQRLKNIKGANVDISRFQSEKEVDVDIMESLRSSFPSEDEIDDEFDLLGK